MAERAKSLSSKILDSIRAEVKASRGGGPVSSDYYAKQANPKDGGYAKSNYAKGDGVRARPEELRAKDLRISVRPNVAKRKG